jgi:predicted DNA-binding protein (MmcQ/YjbR family)
VPGRRRATSPRDGQRARLLTAPRALPGAELTHPFGDDVDVWKVGGLSAAGARPGTGKMFALVSLWDSPGLITLKVDPERGVHLVEEHPAITPGYHTNKRHWISISLDGTVPDELVTELIEDSYDLVLGSLSAQVRFAVDPERFPLPARRSASRPAAPSSGDAP